MSSRKLVVSIVVVVAGVAARGPVARTLAANRAFLQFERCVAPVSWPADPARAVRPNQNQETPSEACLSKVRTSSAAPARLRGRVALVDGDIAARGHRWAEAVESYRRATQLFDGPTPAIAADIVSILINGQKDYAGALRAALEGLRDSPEDPDLRFVAGTLYLFNLPPYSRYREALAVMRPELGFRYPYNYYVVAGAYFGIGDFAQSARTAAEGARLARATDDPNLAPNLYVLGIAQRCLREPAGNAALREGQTLTPHDPKFAAALAADVAALCGEVARE